MKVHFELIDSLFEPCWEAEMDDLRANLTAARASSGVALARQAEIMQLMQKENDELRLRVGVLLRLLIQQGVISADQFASAVRDAKIDIVNAKARRDAESATAPRPKPAKLKLPKSK
jgi:hypothetical protein